MLNFDYEYAWATTLTNGFMVWRQARAHTTLQGCVLPLPGIGENIFYLIVGGDYFGPPSWLTILLFDLYMLPKLVLLKKLTELLRTTNRLSLNPASLGKNLKTLKETNHLLVSWKNGRLNCIVFTVQLDTLQSAI